MAFVGASDLALTITRSCSGGRGRRNWREWEIADGIPIQNGWSRTLRRLRIFFASVGYRSFAQEHLDVSPPIGLLYLAAYTRAHYEVDLRVVDQRAEDITEDDLAKQMADFGPDIVGLGCVTFMAHLLPSLVQRIREALPRALIVLGGPHASCCKGRALEGKQGGCRGRRGR